MLDLNLKLIILSILGFILLFSKIGCTGVNKLTAYEQFENITDEEVYEFVYSGKKYPNNISMEDFKGGSPYYISEWSLDSPYGRSGSKAPLCTEDHDQAKKWAIAQNDSSSSVRELVDEIETEKFHEFRMVNPNRATDIVLFRVDKCSYLDRTSFDHNWLKSAYDTSLIDSVGVFRGRQTPSSAPLWIPNQVGNDINANSLQVSTSF